MKMSYNMNEYKTLEGRMPLNDQNALMFAYLSPQGEVLGYLVYIPRSGEPFLPLPGYGYNGQTSRSSSPLLNPSPRYGPGIYTGAPKEGSEVTKDRYKGRTIDDKFFGIKPSERVYH